MATARPRRLILLFGLLAAVLAGTMTLAAPEAVAQAPQTSVVRAGGLVFYGAVAGQANRVGVFVDERGEVGVTDATPIKALSGCRQADTTFVTCGTGISSITVGPDNLDDTVVPEAPIPTLVQGDEGNDTVEGGRVPGDSRTTFEGGPQFDRIDYSGADRFVAVTLDDVANDGRPGDTDNIRSDVEDVTGSRFDDRIAGTAVANVIDGRGGADTLSGLGGPDTFRQGSRPDGADVIAGGPDPDLLDYAARTAGVFVTIDGAANDGQAGEGDNIGGVETVETGAGADTLVGSGAADRLFSAEGDDRVEGRGGVDRLTGGVGADTLLGGPGNDLVISQDGVRDNVNCGAGAQDGAQVDVGLDVVLGCERINPL